MALSDFGHMLSVGVIRFALAKKVDKGLSPQDTVHMSAAWWGAVHPWVAVKQPWSALEGAPFLDL